MTRHHTPALIAATGLVVGLLALAMTPTHPNVAGGTATSAARDDAPAISPDRFPAEVGAEGVTRPTVTGRTDTSPHRFAARGAGSPVRAVPAAGPSGPGLRPPSLTSSSLGSLSRVRQL